MSQIYSPESGKKIRDKLSAYIEPRFLDPTQSKLGILFMTALLGGPFALLIPFMGRSGRTSLWPLIAAEAMITGWALFVGIGHRSISEADYLALSPEERAHRLYYESMWWRLYSGGFGIFTSGALVWGTAEIMIRFNFFAALPWFLGSYLLGLGFCFYKRWWIAKVYTEGAKKHKWFRPLVIITFGIIGLMPMLGGVVRMVQVSKGEEAAKQILSPVLFASVWVLAVAILVLSVIAFLIAHAQYQEWRKK